MPSKPLSDRVKKHKVNRANDTRLREAAQAYLDGQNGSEKLTFRKIEEMYPGVKKSTLERFINGKGKTMLEFNATKQKLSQIEENVLVDLIVESPDRGFPLKHLEIRQFANAIQQSRLGTDCKSIGHYWIFGFLDRHHDRLATHWSKPLDMQRARSLNPESVKSWFDIVEKFITKPEIDPKNIYGMDESGFPTAYGGKDRVVGERGTKT
jgi:Tc5 transposase DNA-binding domain